MTWMLLNLNSLSITPDGEFAAYFDEDDKLMHTDHIRHQISKQIDLYSGQPWLKHLEELAKFLFLIPHSNAYRESIFSTVRKICTNGRDGKDATQGQASTSVYTEKTSIRKNLLGILVPKMNIFGKKLAWYEWEPTRCILARVKSATYKKFCRLGNNNNKQ